MSAGKLAAQAGLNFFGAPMGKAQAESPYDGSPTGRQTFGRAARPTRAVAQAGGSVLLKAPLAADAEEAAEGGEGEERFQSGLCKAHALPERRADFPRHPNRRATPKQNENCQPCLCPHVSTMSMPRAVGGAAVSAMTFLAEFAVKKRRRGENMNKCPLP